MDSKEKIAKGTEQQGAKPARPKKPSRPAPPSKPEAPSEENIKKKDAMPDLDQFNFMKW